MGIIYLCKTSQIHMTNLTLQDYIYQFSHLRTDINHNRWTPSTFFRAPHKPILLLSILDLFAQGSYPTNWIEITPALGENFSIYWAIVAPPDKRGNMALPFFHLRSSRFWHHLPIPGRETLCEASRQVDTLSQLQKLILGAKLDDELFQLLQLDEPRNALRTILIQTYFAPEYHAVLLAQGSVNLQAFLYSQQLIDKAQKQVNETASREDQYQTIVRDQGFRRAVVQVYDHRCAFCGVRMLTADGHSAVEAAHIVPWSISHNDDPRNGMALCRLCHWTFDEGMTSVSAKYTVLLSTELRTMTNVAGHLLTLESRPILGPVELKFMPDHKSLIWHRFNIYRTA
jgi:putative restriction endonuclease